MKKIITLLFLLIVVPAFAKAKISGSLRNDAYGIIKKNDFVFNNTLQGKLILDAKNKKWKFYGDLRFYLFNGENAPAVFSNTLADNYDIKLMRAFIRYFSTIGDFTLGKTYVSFGIGGLFNPFDFNKSLNVSDTSYDKEGNIAFEYIFYGGDVFEGKIYGSLNNLDIESIKDYTPKYSAGLSLMGTVGTFDLGFIANRLGSNRNITGVYFKGDVEVGLQASYAFHFNDSFNEEFAYFNELSAGIDYSFLDSHLITKLMFYFNQSGETDPANYKISNDYFFNAKYYLYGNITYMIDEFLSIYLDCFLNAADWSAVILPTLKWTVTDGINLTVAFVIPTAVDTKEFSQSTVGYFSTLIRVEGKF